MPVVFPKQQPTLITKRLRLRPFHMRDASCVKSLAGSREIADTTLTIPHPYPDGGAEEWIRTLGDGYRKGQSVTFAVVRRKDRRLIGAIGLSVHTTHERAELGYWIGLPYWGQGYCTEAARKILHFGFIDLGLNRIHSRHLTRNPASGRVMQKAGMQHEGQERQHVRKWGKFEDLETYGVLRVEFEASIKSSR